MPYLYIALREETSYSIIQLSFPPTITNILQAHMPVTINAYINNVCKCTQYTTPYTYVYTHTIMHIHTYTYQELILHKYTCMYLLYNILTA